MMNDLCVYRKSSLDWRLLVGQTMHFGESISKLERYEKEADCRCS